MHHHEQRILLRRVEARRLHDHVVNARAALALEPEVLGRGHVQLRERVRGELRERLVTAALRIDPHDFRRVGCRVEVRDQHRLGSAVCAHEVEVDTGGHLEGQLGFAAAARAPIEFDVSGVLAEHEDVAIVRRDGEGDHVAVGRQRDRRTFFRSRPIERTEVRRFEDAIGATFAQRVQAAAVGAELRLAPALAAFDCIAASEPARLAACHLDLPELGVREVVSGAMRVTRRGEDERLSVGSPHEIDFGAAGRSAAGKSRLLDERSAREQVARLRLAEHLHERMRLPVGGQPLIPIADREARVGAHVVFARFLFLDDLAHVSIVARVRVDVAREGDPRAIRRKLRQARTGADLRYALRFATDDEIEHVDLIGFIALTLRRKGDALAVHAPGLARFRRACLRQATRRRLAVSGDQPQIARLFVFFVRRLDYGEHRETTVRADCRSTDARHEPDVAMSDGFAILRMQQRRKQTCE